jgi:hypothetical protein
VPVVKLIALLPLASVLVLAQCGGEARPVQTAQLAPVPSASSSTPSAARTYPIRMHSDTRVGDRTHAVIDDDKRDQTVTKMAGQPASKSDKVTHAHLDGIISVQEVDDRANARRAEIVVTEFWQTTGEGARVVLAPAGAHVMVTRAARKADAVLTVNGQEATKEQRGALDGLMTLTIGGPSDDEIFGTTAPQAIGAEWDIQSALAQKDLAEKGIVATSLTGKVKLVGIENVRGTECLDLRADLTIAGITTVDDLPKGSVIESANVDAHMKGLFATDGKGRQAEELETATRMKVRVPTPQGEVLVDIKSVDRRRASYSAP